MSKYKAAEDRVEAFGDGEDWHLNAVVGQSQFGSSEMAYIWGYESAVGSLTAAAVRVASGLGQPYPGTDVIIDTIIYPQIFCARHYVELSLKCMLRRVGIIIGRDVHVPIPPTHDLSKLLEILLKTTEKHAHNLFPYVEKMRSMVRELSAVDDDGDAFRYSVSKGEKPHLSSMNVVNVERFQYWFDSHRPYVEDAFYAIGYELNELDFGASTKYYRRHELTCLAERLPQKDCWDSQVMRDFYDEEKSSRPDMSYKQFQHAVKLVLSRPWLSIKIGKEAPLPDVGMDLFERLLDPARPAVSPEEWGALYWIFKVGAGDEPEEYVVGMDAAKKRAIELEEWNKVQEERSVMMTERQRDEEVHALTDGSSTFALGAMAVYGCEGKIRANLPKRAFVICRGLTKLGQPTLLANFHSACEAFGVDWAEPPSRHSSRPPAETDL